MEALLGETVSDKVTGFRGIVTGRVQYLTGCTQLLVQPKVDEKGAFVESRWFDVDRMQVEKVEPVKIDVVTSGPDSSAPRK